MKIFSLAAIFGLSLALISCQSNDSLRPAARSGSPKVAILLPLTGKDAALGKALLNSAQMAVLDQGGADFVLIVKDTNQTGGVAQALQDAVKEGARLVIGPVFAAQVREVAPIAQAKGVQIISFSNDETLTSQGVFVGGLTLPQQINRVISYSSTQGIKRIALLLPDNTYGRVVESSAIKSADATGVEIFQTEFYNPANTNFSETVKRLGPGDPVPLLDENTETDPGNSESDLTENSDNTDIIEEQQISDNNPPPAWMPPYKPVKVVNYQALLIAEGGEKLITLSSLAPYHGIDTTQVKLLGTNLWDAPALRKETSLLGGWYPSYSSEAHDSFEKRYRENFKESPNRLAATVYDIVVFVTRLGGKPGADFSRNAIIGFGEMNGVNGIFRFLPDGIAEYGLTVYEIQRQRLLVKDPAPSTLMPLTN